MRRAAALSACGRYRYDLSRSWAEGARVAFVGLNPSTADAEVDDPTIRRCVGFARAWGFGALRMVNLFAWRATDPRELALADDPVGVGNDAILRELRETCTLVVAAWGAHRMALERAATVVSLLGDFTVLGLTAAGHPRHPLYMRASCRPLDPLTLQAVGLSGVVGRVDPSGGGV